ncbi:TetR/AcrR family transcriptional regulator [Agromyces protaetiae]|uniref:TetR/AcrR family transcriptional regulator n=1 Tax=Agromyces protaetiae TaxID=2509455 RepID=A0A4P6FDH4_9MICO|nr:TetR/AcrR family transcriptional regulator [Agromyces protaetiae]QAY72409.1 TetR/AcrR family transcriptional regulator [Agromyces protaetiae]
MAARGSYAKGVAKREEILATALDVIARNGYGRASIRELAAAVGLSQAGLLHYFSSKEELFAEILRARDDVDRGIFVESDDATEATDAPGPASDGEAEAAAPTPTIEGYRRLIRHNADVPGLVQLYVNLSAEATDPNHPAHAYFRERYSVFREAAARGIRRAQTVGEVSPDVDPEIAATLLLALADGLQTQWLMDPSIDMGEHIDAFLRRLRRTAPPERGT